MITNLSQCRATQIAVKQTMLSLQSTMARRMHSRPWTCLRTILSMKQLLLCCESWQKAVTPTPTPDVLHDDDDRSGDNMVRQFDYMYLNTDCIPCEQWHVPSVCVCPGGHLYAQTGWRILPCSARSALAVAKATSNVTTKV